MRNDFSSMPGTTPATYPHTTLTGLYWWDWNANSGDTGGIVENDWVTVRPSQCASPLRSPCSAGDAAQVASRTLHSLSRPLVVLPAACATRWPHLAQFACQEFKNDKQVDSDSPECT